MFNRTKLAIIGVIIILSGIGGVLTALGNGLQAIISGMFIAVGLTLIIGILFFSFNEGMFGFIDSFRSYKSFKAEDIDDNNKPKWRDNGRKR